MTVSQAAARLGVSPARVRQFIEEKRLKAVKRPAKGNRPYWWITVSDLKAVADRKTGRPKKSLASAA